VSYGLKTGANPFFIRENEDWADDELESYVTPIL
jgi:hypothetical protein